MPIGEEDVITSLDSSNSETTPDQQVPPEPQGEGAAGADSKPEVETVPPTDGADAPKKDADTNPDPVQEAMARLARPDAKPVPKASDPPREDPPKEKPVSSAPEKAAKQPEGKEKAGPTLDDPYAGWPLAEQPRKQQTRQWIEKLHQRWTEAEKHPNRQLGNDFQSMLDRHKLSEDIGFVPPDHLADLVKLQAAVNRGLYALEQGRRPAGADIQALQALESQVGVLRTKFGIAPSEPATPAIVPHKGPLSQEYQDLVDVYQIPEERVRMLAALERSNEDVVARAAQPPAPQDNRPEGVDMEAIHARRFSKALEGDGVPADRFVAYQKVLEPTMQRIVAEEFPGISTAQAVEIFNSLGAKDRVDITLRAYGEYKTARTAPPQSKTGLPPQTRAPLRGAPPRAQAPDPNLNPVESAIARLARQE